MTPTDYYIQYSERTEKTPAKILADWESKDNVLTAIRYLHAQAGIASESGEICDAIKAHVFYGKPIDRTHIMEEMGDLFWYLAILCRMLNLEFEKIMRANIDKLRATYGDAFSNERAINRDLTTERQVLDDVQRKG